MRIDQIDMHLIRVPIDMGVAPKAFAGTNWKSIDTLYVRVLTDEGVEGWGEGWGHIACPTTRAALTSLVAPAFVGRDIGSRSELMREMQYRFHNHGRTGPVAYALSAIEIALWDIAGKQAGQPIATLLGGAPCTLDAYASLLRYSEPALVAAAVEHALAQGFRHIKLHEESMDAIQAAREAAGSSTWLALDVNCPWSPSQAIERARALEPLGLAWLEEPVWPPEDRYGLAQVRAATTIPVAAGENVMSPHDMVSMLEAGALDICQPSVIKFGGIAAVAEVADIAAAKSVDCVPHCFYFGAGFLASLHLAAAFARTWPFELFFGDLEASPYHDAVRARNGRVTVPNGPGLGVDPDMAVIERYRLGAVESVTLQR